MILLLALLLLSSSGTSIISGLQPGPAFTASFGIRRQASCLRESSAFAVDTDTDDGDTKKNDSSLLVSTTNDQKKTKNHPIPIAYDWDDQFEELQSFMSEYGHCNFPQKNPSKELQERYPMLKRFCHDQRKEYSLLQKNKVIRGSAMSLRVFDRDVRCRRLGELGFDFNLLSSKWYDSYHDLIQYQRENGHTRVTVGENESLANWVYVTRRRQNELSDSQIKLLDEIGFGWKSDVYDEQWDARYKELVAFHNKHGHLVLQSYDGPLYDWIKHQQNRRRGQRGRSAITAEQIALLDEIDFPWTPQRRDARWYAKYNELRQFRKKYGHCQPESSKHRKQYCWVFYQQKRHQKGILSPEQKKLLEEIDFPFEPRQHQWSRMYGELNEYSKTHGNLQVSQDDNPELYEWMAKQRNRYMDIDADKENMLSDQRIEKLEDLHFCWSLDWRERTWHDKYTEAVEFFKEHGHVRVAEEENPSLFNWIEMQEKRYKEVKGQKPLSEEEVEMLEQIDFPFLEGQPRMGWNAKYAEVKSYRDETDGRFPTSHKEDPDLNRWIRQQRYRYRAAYGYAPLSDEQKMLLERIDFPRDPQSNQGRAWYNAYDKLVDFRQQHGHFLVGQKKDNSLQKWIDKQRMRYHGTNFQLPPNSKMQMYLLDQIDFPWTSNRLELEWQEIYDEVAEFLETHGHFPGLSDDKKLARWILFQRQRYKGNGTSGKLSNLQIEQLEKIGFRWSMYS